MEDFDLRKYLKNNVLLTEIKVNNPILIKFKKEIEFIQNEIENGEYEESIINGLNQTLEKIKKGKFETQRQIRKDIDKYWDEFEGEFELY